MTLIEQAKLHYRGLNVTIIEVKKTIYHELRTVVYIATEWNGEQWNRAWIYNGINGQNSKEEYIVKPIYGVNEAGKQDIISYQITEI